MKNKILLSVLALFALVCMPLQAADKKSDNTPAGSVKAFYTAMKKGEFATAKRYVQTKELLDLITGVENLAKEVPELKADCVKIFTAAAAGKAVSEKITGDTAEVVWAYREPETKKMEKDTIKLKKISGIWKILN